MNSINDDEKYVEVSLKLANIWEQAITNHVFNSSNLISTDPFEIIDNVLGSLTPSKLKVGQFLQQYGSQGLHDALEVVMKSGNNSRVRVGFG